MEPEPGDDYLRRIATFIRANEKGLAEAGYVRRRRPQRRHSHTVTSNATSVFNPVGWFVTSNTDTPPRSPASPPKPVTFTIDTHRLFYILMRLEGLGIDIGTLDVRVDNPSKPMHYTHIDLGPGSADKSETLSLASFRSSLSAVSGLSLGVGWWARTEQLHIDTELKFVYSAFTKLPALLIRAPGPKVIAELADEAPNQNALPLDAFKNLQTLECVDVDPRALLGWDRLAESLRSLTIKRSGLEDVTDIFIGAVLDDQARRDGTLTDQRTRQIPRRQRSFTSTPLPASVPEDAEEGSGNTPTAEYPQVPSPGSALSPYKWGLLKHLSLADNALTFLPTDPLPYLVSLTHLDLSSNLLVSVPHGIAVLHNLISLNLSDNMIDSVLGIHTHLGQILSLNLAGNRLESICGLERLMGLERVDLRSNHIDESAEIGRLATLPNIVEVWVEGNPLTEIEEGWRVACFDLFWREGKEIVLDGAGLSFVERRGLTAVPTPQMSSSRTVMPPLPASPPVVPIRLAKSRAAVPISVSAPGGFAGGAPELDPSSSAAGSRTASPMLSAAVVGRPKKRKVKRIVDLNGAGLDPDSSSPAPAPSLSLADQPSPLSPSTSPRRPSPLSPNHRRSYTAFEPPSPSHGEREGGRGSERESREAEVYRARIEALRADMGDGWLKVFSQSQVSEGVGG
ncbi:hypothetical protein HYDPIDRAFT_107828 [Hydnomerulius pinastri MD-312]|nr:hypothetical protein HYDPIDRAFT_107828 [Hydnomerulius pinastri MD-312]